MNPDELANAALFLLLYLLPLAVVVALASVAGAVMRAATAVCG